MPLYRRPVDSHNRNHVALCRLRTVLQKPKQTIRVFLTTFPDHFFLTTFPAVFPFFPLSSFVHSAQRTDFTLIIFGKSDQGSKGSELIDTLGQYALYCCRTRLFRKTVLYINSLCLRMIMQKLENFVDSFHRATLLFGSNGFYYSTFTAHNEPQMRLPSLHVSRICHHPKPAYSSKPHQPGRGNVPVARNPNPKPHKRQNQTIRKNSTIPQSNFYSSWGLSPEVPFLFFSSL